MKDKDYVKEINDMIEVYIDYKEPEFLEKAKQILEEMKANKKALAGHKSA